MLAHKLSRKVGVVLNDTFGILTTANRNNLVGGNLVNFRRIIYEAHRQGRSCPILVLTSDGAIVTYRWKELTHQFIRTRDPWPSVLYNRIPTREREQDRIVRQQFTQLTASGRTITNPRFLSKKEVITSFLTLDSDKVRIPEFIAWPSYEGFTQFLSMYPDVYVKPNAKKAGEGIYVLRDTSKSDGFGTCRLFAQQAGQLKRFGVVTTKQAYTFLQKKNAQMDYYVQADAHPLRFAKRRFDLRVLVQKRVDDRFSVTGMGIRLAKAPESITTHVPNGGQVKSVQEILPALFSLAWPSIDDAIHQVSLDAADTLAKLPGIWSEFTFDMGLTLDGKPILYEANAKPMKFDERKIEQLAKQRIVERLIALASIT